MFIRNQMHRFAKNRDGAVTVDWVVLTAALVMLGIISVAIYRPGLMTAATNISDAMTEVAASMDP